MHTVIFGMPNTIIWCDLQKNLIHLMLMIIKKRRILLKTNMGFVSENVYTAFKIFI